VDRRQVTTIRKLHSGSSSAFVIAVGCGVSLTNTDVRLLQVSLHTFMMHRQYTGRTSPFFIVIAKSRCQEAAVCV
jgi:hypothetical protein